MSPERTRPVGAHVVQRQRDRRRRGVARLDDVVGDHHVRAGAVLAQALGDGLDDAQVGLVRHQHVDVGGGEPGQLDGPLRPPARSWWWPSGRRPGPPGAAPRSPSLIMIALARSPALPQATGPMPTDSASVAAPTTAAPAPSAKMIAVERSVQSTQSESFSAPITSTCFADPGADHVRGRADRVAEAGAGGVEVERGRRRDADAFGGLRGGVGDRVGHRAGRDDDGVDVGGGQPGVLHRPGAGLGGHVDQQEVLGRDPPVADADAVADPLVVGVHASWPGRRWRRSARAGCCRARAAGPRRRPVPASTSASCRSCRTTVLGAAVSSGPRARRSARLLCRGRQGS